MRRESFDNDALTLLLRFTKARCAIDKLRLLFSNPDPRRVLPYPGEFTEPRGSVMADLTKPEIKAICRVLRHFLDGGWNEILESLGEEQSERFFDEVESGHQKLARLRKAA
jgi:hypothetical protein